MRDLPGRERMIEDFDLDAFVGERARGIEAERLQIARHHFHGGDAAFLHGGHELGAARERRSGRGQRAGACPGLRSGVVVAPQAEPLRVGEILDRRRAGRGDIDDAGIGQRMLEPQACEALLGRSAVATLALAAGRIGHGVRFVEDNDAVAIAPEPIDDLGKAGSFALAFGRAQRRVGREQDAFA